MPKSGLAVCALLITNKAMDAAASSKPKVASRGLMLFLRVVQAFIAAGMVASLLIGCVFLFDNPLREQIMADADGDWMARRLFLLGLIGAVVAAAWFYIVTMIIRLVRTVQQGDPFVEANISRLRTMWIVLALTEVFRIIAHAAAGIAVSPNKVSQAETGFDIQLPTIFLVVIIAVLSEAFRLGVEMRRDAELTI